MKTHKGRVVEARFRVFEEDTGPFKKGVGRWYPYVDGSEIQGVGIHRSPNGYTTARRAQAVAVNWVNNQ